VSKPCSVCVAPRDVRASIDLELSRDVVPGTRSRSRAALAQAHGISQHALGRHLRNNHAQRGALALTSVDADESLNFASLLDRLLDASASARRTRLAAEADNHRRDVLASISVESQVLQTLLLKLGVTETTTVEMLAEARKLASAVGRVSRESPALREQIAQALEAVGAEDTAADLRAAD
jgi:Fe2+ transport system protein FeoA